VREKLKRFEKPEDKYIDAIEYLKNIRAVTNTDFDALINEMLLDDSILKFGRFINYENMLISGRLLIDNTQKKEHMTGGKKNNSKKKNNKKNNSKKKNNKKNNSKKKNNKKNDKNINIKQYY